MNFFYCLKIKNYINYIKYYIRYKKQSNNKNILYYLIMYYSVYYYLHCINRKDKLYINLLKVKFLIQTNSKLIHINACGIFYFYSPYLLDVL